MTNDPTRADGGGCDRDPVGSDVVVEPASPTARPVWWEDSDGNLCGPATPELLGKTGAGEQARFWVIVTYQDASRWIQSDRLRAHPTMRSR